MDRLFVGVGAGLAVVEVLHRRQGLHMQLEPVGGPVEASGHEVCTPVLAKQPRLGHVDARVDSHQIVGVLD